MGGGKARGPMAGLAQMMGFGGGMPSPGVMAKLAVNMPGGLPGAGVPGAGGLPPSLPGLPGLPRRPGGPWFPGLPGLGGGKLPTPGGLPPNFPGFGKKK
jgi:signal recognition particle subunit SRP54